MPESPGETAVKWTFAIIGGLMLAVGIILWYGDVLLRISWMLYLR